MGKRMWLCRRGHCVVAGRDGERCGEDYGGWDCGAPMQPVTVLDGHGLDLIDPKDERVVERVARALNEWVRLLPAEVVNVMGLRVTTMARDLLASLTEEADDGA